MRALPLVAATLLVAGLPAATDAAPVCRQLVDASGDGVAFGTVPTPALDILSGDVATGPRTLVVALRLAALHRDEATATGVVYQFFWTAGDLRQGVAYVVYADGSAQGSFDPETTGTVSGEVVVPVVADPSTGTVTWTVPRTLVTPLARRGARLSGLVARANASVNARAGDGQQARSAFLGGDTGESSATYVDRTRTCVKAT